MMRNITSVELLFGWFSLFAWTTVLVACLFSTFTWPLFLLFRSDVTESLYAMIGRVWPSTSKQVWTLLSAVSLVPYHHISPQWYGSLLLTLLLFLLNVQREALCHSMTNIPNSSSVLNCSTSPSASFSPIHHLPLPAHLSSDPSVGPGKLIG